MSEKKPNKLMVPPRGGVFRDLLMRIKLILRLMGDRRVNIFLKLLPLASLAYLFWPFDVISLPIIGAVDDAAVLWLGSYLFVELCPPNVVQEHLKNLTSNMDMIDNPDEVVDAETKDVTEEEK